ncbi:MAG: WxL domain surface cell wall-binding [Actinomycetota bacterium]|jgi:hypothetical protein|nr:WxL domain surface cell wall-binding [Actinomycetota bacterium]MDQ1497032.1 WxL domain surface cell wall-binding [Actinomycetota bacterium]
MRRTRIIACLAGSAALIAGLAPSAFAATSSVTQALTAGARSASMVDLTLPSLAYSHAERTPNGSMTLTADDSTGSNAGWNVTIQSSAFVWTAGGEGASTGTNIPAANFALTSAAVPTVTAGQAVNVTATFGPEVGVSSGTLDAARKVIQAGPTYGNGTYTQALGVSLLIPAQSAAGTYTGTLTTTITAAP